MGILLPAMGQEQFVSSQLWLGRRGGVSEASVGSAPAARAGPWVTGGQVSASSSTWCAWGAYVRLLENFQSDKLVSSGGLRPGLGYQVGGRSVLVHQGGIVNVACMRDECMSAVKFAANFKLD